MYKSLEGYRWRPLKDYELLYAARITLGVLALDKDGGLPLRRKTRSVSVDGWCP